VDAADRGAGVDGRRRPRPGAFGGRNGRIAIISSWPPCDWDEPGLKLLEPDGSALQPVNCEATSAEWLADGRRLLVRGRPFGLGIIAPDGSLLRRVRPVEQPRRRSGPRR
jgi:hypothetical protein